MSLHQVTEQDRQSRWVRLAKMWIIVVVLVALVLAISQTLVMTLSILLLVFAGLLFGIFIHAIASWPARKLQLPYRFWYGIFVFFLLLFLAGGFYYLGSQIGQRASNLATELQSSVTNAQQRLSQYDWASQYVPDQQQLKKMLTESSGSYLPEMMKGLRWLGWLATAAIVILFIGFYAAYEPGLYRSGLIRLVPPNRRIRAREVLNTLHSALSYWIVGRLVSMSLVGIITAIGLWWLGVPLPVTLGLVAAFLTFIPNLGPVLAALPQVLLALNVGSNVVLYVIIFNLVLQGVESYLITPIIQRHEVSLPPILTITAQLTMGVWLGVIGIMMAAPLVVVMMVLVQMLYIQDRLGDENAGQL